MNAVVFIGLGLFGAATLVLWIYAFRDLARNPMFSGGTKTVWFVIILLGPVGGSIAYLSAMKNIEKYSVPDRARLDRLLRK